MEKSNDEPEQCLVPRVGKSAPLFCGRAVINGSVRKIHLQDFKGKYVVLIFCNEDFFESPPPEIIDFIRNYDAFNRVSGEIIVCSTDSVHSHLAWIMFQRKLAGLENIRVTLLSDKNSHISKSYGVYEESTGFCIRALFIIDKAAVLRHVSINDSKVGISANEVKRIIYEMENIPLPVDQQKQANDISLFVPKKEPLPMTTNKQSQSKQEPNNFNIATDSMPKKKPKRRTASKILRDSRPTELRVKKRETSILRPNVVHKHESFENGEIPAYLLHSLRVEIDIADKSKDSFKVYVKDKLRASLVKPVDGKADILCIENCSVNVDGDKGVVGFSTDEVTIKVLRKLDEIAISIDDTTVTKKVKGRFGYFTAEASSKSNHIVNILGKCLLMDAKDTEAAKEIYDYTVIEAGGNRIFYYRKFKE